jgi:hypothetical protein
LETASTNRESRLKDFYDFRKTGIEEGRTEEMKRIVIEPGKDPGKALDLVKILLRAGIEVDMTRESFRTSARSYTGNNTAAARDFPAGTYVIDLAQPQKRLAKALLEPNTEQDGAFVREQIARFLRNQRRGENALKEDYGFYDITAWSLPRAFGVETHWTQEVVHVTKRRLLLTHQAENVQRLKLKGEPLVNDDVMWADPLPRSDSSNLQFSSVFNTGRGANGRARIAYVIPYERDGAASLVYRLQREGFRLAVATRALSAGGRDWPRGTIVARVSRNSDTLHDSIARIARETGVEVEAVNTGFNETGETGIGSENVIALKVPRIIVAADDAVSQTSYGSMWHLLDRFDVDFTPMTIANIKRAELDKYNVIILPDGSADGYYSAFGKSGVDALRGWITRGGTLVCIKGAAVFAALKDVNLTSSRLVGSDEDDVKGAKSDASAEPKPSPSPTAASTDRDTSAVRSTSNQSKKSATEQRRDEANQTEKLEGAAPELPPIASPSARPGVVPEAVPGAIMRATIDRTTYLTYGYEEKELPVLLASGYFFRPSKEGTNAVVFAKTGNQSLRIAGFVWPDNTERLLNGTAYVIDEPTGRGHVVIYAEDPVFRGIWRNMTRLFFNSMLFSSAF